jgi:multidrug efflux pump subunit AcrB
MSGWAIVAIVAIVVWGVVQMAKAKAGIISDEDGNETFVGTNDAPSKAETEEMRLEMQQLRERLQVLERIATDNNTMDARERARISAEIEALRGTEDSGIPLPTSASEKEQSQ